jgi:predicted PurR-regulated permease PerM
VKARLIRRSLIGLGTLVLLAAVVLFIAHIPRTVTVFMIAAFIAFGATPLVTRLESRLPRTLSIGIVYAALLGAVVIIAVVVIPVTYAQVLSLLFHAPDYVSASQDLVAQADRALQARIGNHGMLPSVASLQAEVGGRVAAALTTALDSVGTIVIATANALFIGVSSLILSVFFVTRGPLLGQSLLEFVPPRRRDHVKGLFDEIASIFGHFIYGQVLLCAVVGIVIWLFLLPFHFNFALLVAVMCGLLYAVPFVGMIVAQLLAAVLAIPQGSAMVISVSLVIFVVARIADNVLVPKVMSESVGVSPIAVMFSVFAGGELFGIPGLLLGIPAAALIKVLFKFFVQPYVLRMQFGDGSQIDLLVPPPAGTDVPPAGPPKADVSSAAEVAPGGVFTMRS